MRDDHRQVRLDMRDPKQARLYKACCAARQKWGDQGIKMDAYAVATLNAKSHLENLAQADEQSARDRVSGNTISIEDEVNKALAQVPAGLVTYKYAE